MGSRPGRAADRRDLFERVVPASHMTDTFYLDESGHSGDLTATGAAFDFMDQPFFVLAAVGIPDTSSFAYEIDAIRAHHRIPSGELKAKSLQSKPEFVGALFDAVLRLRSPLFIEVVDKKYFIVVNIVHWMLFPSIMGFPEGAAKHFIQNTLAQFLYKTAPERVLQTFVEACVRTSDAAVASAFESLLEFHATAVLHDDQRDLMSGLNKATRAAWDEYLELRADDAFAHEHFVPPPDRNKRGKDVWMLPNQSSFANVCARINLFRGGTMAGVRLVHDQQLEVADILRDSKARMERLRQGSFTPHADYLLTGESALEFANSSEEFGVQIADVVAGTTMRFYRDMMRASGEIHPAIERAMMAVLRRTDPTTSWGVNLVGSDEYLL